LSLGHDLGETSLTDSALAEHREAAADGPDLLTVNCGGEPVPTVPPTATPTPTSTPVPTTPPAASPTNTPRPATPTPTRPPATPTPPIRRCDVNGDGRITSTDALWVLWDVADIVRQVPNPQNADCDGNGRVDVVDALFILWIEGGDLPAPAG
jgi:hypothetical protein